jgi:glutamate racemase
MFLANMFKLLTKNSCYLIKNKQKQAKMTKNSLKTRKNDKKSNQIIFSF